MRTIAYIVLFVLAVIAVGLGIIDLEQIKADVWAKTVELSRDPLVWVITMLVGLLLSMVLYVVAPKLMQAIGVVLAVAFVLFVIGGVIWAFGSVLGLL